MELLPVLLRGPADLLEHDFSYALWWRNLLVTKLNFTFRTFSLMQVAYDRNWKLVDGTALTTEVRYQDSRHLELRWIIWIGKHLLHIETLVSVWLH